VGSAEIQKYKRGNGQTQTVKTLNSAFLVSPQSGKNDPQRYDKIRLFPFGEYIPYKNIIPWSYFGVPDIDNFMLGKTPVTFDFSGSVFATTICWENLFPSLVRQFAKNGAQFIVNITNEAWFGKTAAPYQFVSMNVFRAVENRVYIVRCANSGVSCFIDANGRVLKRLVDEHGRDIFTSGTLNGSVVAIDSRTLYTQFGDWFVWLNLMATALVLLISFKRSRKVSSIRKGISATAGARKHPV